VLSNAQARAVRRMLLVGAATAATLGAHAAAGGFRIVPTAPLLWGVLLVLAAVIAPSRADWRPRRAFALLPMLLATQAALHAAITYAPWAFGVVEHHRAPLVSATAFAAHAAAAVVFAGVLAFADRLLQGARRVAARVRALLADTVRGHGAPFRLAPLASSRPPGAERLRPTSRGPPSPRVA
jgi:hypothetical protein